MQTLQSWKEKIQEKRKNTSFREYVKQIVSWFPVVFHKTQGYMSRYPQTERIWDVSANKDFAVIRDGLLDYGKEYSAQESIFVQLHDLMKEIPLSATISQMAWENTDYADTVVGSSHAYVSAAVINECSWVYYSYVVFDYCKDVFDSLRVGSYSEDVYNSSGILKSSKIFYSRFINNSSNIRFSANLTGCHECIACSNLENMSYCIKNKQYAKEEYQAEKKRILEHKGSFEKIIASLPTTSTNYGSENVQGNHIINSTNVQNGYYANRLENGRNVICVWWEDQEKNFYDMFDAGVHSSDMYANEWSWVYSNNIYCSSQVERSSNIFHSYYLVNCSYCFACVWLQNRQYCILNKQYEKEEWEEKVHEIFVEMEQRWELGSFFPASMNPFYFNDTWASLIEEFEKDEIVSEWYLRRNEEIKVDIPQWMEIVELENLSQYEWREEIGWEKKRVINPEILKKVIRDQKGNVFRVIKQEYDFLMKYSLPLPRKHWLERVKNHFRMK